MSTANVVYVMPDKLGGSLTVNGSLIEHHAGGAMPQHVVLTHNVRDMAARSTSRLGADSLTTVDYALPVENLYAVLERLWRALPKGPGVLVANDLLELAMLHLHDPGRAVVQIVHGDSEYYYALAERHDAVVDVFVTISWGVYETLKLRLPHRTAEIHYLPYGIATPTRRRAPNTGPLRLLFLGRLDQQKGVLDLPAIDARLNDRDTRVEWGIIGSGPAEVALRASWRRAGVTWFGQLPAAEVLERIPEYDVLVLPTRAEGMPLVLVEAMTAGLVPVTTNLESIQEIVTDDVSGRLVNAGDIDRMAAAITRLARDREYLERLSSAAHAAVANRFEPSTRVAAYRDLFAQWQTLRRERPERLSLPYGSRLDQPWMPNQAVRAVRSTLRRFSRR